jgi:hypothetical protein
LRQLHLLLPRPGGGVDVLATDESGPGGFQVIVFNAAGNFGGAVGQITYDIFNKPTSNALAGRIDPATGLAACPISRSTHDGLVGLVITCPK